MITGKYNIIAPQGSTYKLTFVISTDDVGWNLSTYTARMQVRSSTNSATTILNLSSTAGDITLDSVGSVTVTVSAEVMSAALSGRHVYDFELESAGGEVTRILEGRFAITKEVTR